MLKYLFLLILSLNVAAFDSEYDGLIIGSINPFNSLYLISDLYNSKKSVFNLYINSGGGMVMFGDLIIDQMLIMKRKGVIFNCYLQGIVASMAFTIAQNCDNRISYYDTYFMQHHTYYIDSRTNKRVILRDNSSNVMKLLCELKRIRMRYKDYLLYFIESERLFNPIEALSIGAIDEIIY